MLTFVALGRGLMPARDCFWMLLFAIRFGCTFRVEVTARPSVAVLLRRDLLWLEATTDRLLLLASDERLLFFGFLTVVE